MNQSHRSQIKRYGGMDGYRAEMRRRNGLRKHIPGGSFRDRRFASDMAKKRHQKHGQIQTQTSRRPS